MQSERPVLILGCGVIGLSTGIELLRRGHKVAIWAKDLPPNTTSDKAAAVWYPYLCSPRKKAIPWAKATFKRFQEDIIPDLGSGCMMRTITKIFDKPQPDPWWKDAYPHQIERLNQSALPAGYVDAYKFETVVIDTSTYMPYLVNMFKELRGSVIQREVKSVEEATSYDIVVNCTGLGSKELFHDEKIYPVRGQMIKTQKTDFNEVVVDDDGPNSLALAVARNNDNMLGGTVQENDWDTEPRIEDTEEILERVRTIVPSFENVEVLSVSVGLRPARDAVRLEKEELNGKTVIHNYGHGGAGFTLSWGCAEDVANLVRKVTS